MPLAEDTLEDAASAGAMPQAPVAVTFVVSVFNKSLYLSDCLKSIQEQTLRNTEILCVNDASTDASSEILNDHRKADDRIRVFENPLNRGAGASRNLGIDMARGRYIRIVDADDLLPPDSTEKMYKCAVDSKADIVRGSLALFRGNDPDAIQSKVSVPSRESTVLREESSLWVPWWHTSYLYSHELLRDKNLRYPSLKQGEDPVFLAATLVRARRISMLEDIVYLYRKYPKSTGSGQSTFASISDLLTHASIVKSLFTSHCRVCWDSGYGPFLLQDFKSVLKRTALSETEFASVMCQAELVWGADDVRKMLLHEVSADRVDSSPNERRVDSG